MGRSQNARAAQDRDIDVDYSERAGFLTGKAAAVAEWRFRQEVNDPTFRRLVWRLQAAKYWRAKNPASKARIMAYRARWRETHREQYNAACAKAKRKRRANPKIREAENAERRATRAIESQKRRAETVYTCRVCGSYWSPVGRLPTRPPTYCGTACSSRANYLRGKARGATWALRGASRRDAEGAA